MTSQSPPQSAQGPTTERRKKSPLLDLCKKVQESEHRHPQLDQLMRIIEQQPESKTLLKEIFQTMKNIKNDVCIEYK